MVLMFCRRYSSVVLIQPTALLFGKELPVQYKAAPYSSPTVLSWVRREVIWGQNDEIGSGSQFQSGLVCVMLKFRCPHVHARCQCPCPCPYCPCTVSVFTSTSVSVALSMSQYSCPGSCLCMSLWLFLCPFFVNVRCLCLRLCPCLSNSVSHALFHFKGTLARDFGLPFFYHKKNAPGPLISTLVYFRI
jgi:hypothetical protein